MKISRRQAADIRPKLLLMIYLSISGFWALALFSPSKNVEMITIIFLNLVGIIGSIMMFISFRYRIIIKNHDLAIYQNFVFILGLCLNVWVLVYLEAMARPLLLVNIVFLWWIFLSILTELVLNIRNWKTMGEDIKRHNPKDKDHLFDLEPEYTKYLVVGYTEVELRNAFKEQGYPLSCNALMARNGKDGWIIYDVANTFKLKCSSEELKIYRESKSAIVGIIFIILVLTFVYGSLIIWVTYYGLIPFLAALSLLS